MNTEALPISVSDGLPPFPLPIQANGVAPSPGTYLVTVQWEEYSKGENRQSLLTKHVHISLDELGEKRRVFLRTSSPRLSRKEGVQPVEQLALRVASLYEHVVVDLAPDGQLQRLVNYPQVRQTWEELKPALLFEAAAEDELTRKLVTLVDEQVAHEDRVLYSLRHDYIYQALLQPLEAAGTFGLQASSAREFPNFFPNANLWFAVTKKQTVADERELVVSLQGTLDAGKTNVTIIHQHMRAALAAGDTAATPTAELVETQLHFGYEATYVTERASNLLRELTLTVYARLAEHYNKQYTLTVNRLA